MKKKLLRFLADAFEGLVGLLSKSLLIRWIEEAAIAAKDWSQPERIESPLFDGYAECFFDMMTAQPWMRVYIYRIENGRPRLAVSLKRPVPRLADQWQALFTVRQELVEKGLREQFERDPLSRYLRKSAYH